MFAMKVAKGNLSKIAERCADWTADRLGILLAEAALFNEYVIPEYDKHDPSYRGTVVVQEEYLKNNFTYELSDTDWFEITPK